MKVLPGAGVDQMEKAVELANRVSLNLETTGPQKLKRLSPEKVSYSLYENLKTLSKVVQQRKPVPRDCQGSEEKIQDFIPSLSTQLVVGPAGETDKEIVSLAEELHQEYNLRRVYFSAFVPIPETPLENFPSTPLIREHRLYQTDWLIHFYGFKARELVFDKNNNLPLDKDPKLVWAEKNMHLFPMEINKISYEELLRIPGIGPVSAKRILEYRRKNKICNLAELKNLGVATKRALRFILLCGKTPSQMLDRRYSEKLLLPLNL